MNNKQKAATVDASEKLGASAFARGVKAAPALDPEFAKFLRTIPRADFTGRFAIRVLSAWSKGWHTANVCAPVGDANRADYVNGKIV